MNRVQTEPSVETYLNNGMRILIGLTVSGLLAVLLVMVGGCATGAERAPAAWETKFYTIVTNQMPVVHNFTNTIVTTQTVEVIREVPVIKTVTDPQGVTVVATNFYNITNVENRISYATNVVTETNMEASYDYTPNQNAAAVKEGAGVVGGLFGANGLVTTLVGGVFGLYGMMRSSKKGKAAKAAVQSVEMAREVLKTTPQGQALDSELVKYLMQHQAEAGVIQQLSKLVRDHVDNDDAREVADEISNLIQERLAGSQPAAATAGQSAPKA